MGRDEFLATVLSTTFGVDPEDIAIIQHLFDELDEDGNGRLTAADLRRFRHISSERAEGRVGGILSP